MIVNAAECGGAPRDRDDFKTFLRSVPDIERLVSLHGRTAVARQVELDLLGELTGLLDAEHGPVSLDFLAEAETAWQRPEQR